MPHAASRSRFLSAALLLALGSCADSADDPLPTPSLARNALATISVLAP